MAKSLLNGRRKKKSRKKPELCMERGCTRPRRTKNGKRRRCYRCAMKRWRKNNPMRAAYYALRDRARHRRIEFTISFQEFEQFALISGYLNGVGNHAHSITIDRINNLRGYVPGNLQPLTRAENARKQALYDERRMKAGYSWQ